MGRMIGGKYELTFPTKIPQNKKKIYRYKYSRGPEEPPFLATQKAAKRNSPVISREIEIYACNFTTINTKINVD